MSLATLRDIKGLVIVVGLAIFLNWFSGAVLGRMGSVLLSIGIRDDWEHIILELHEVLAVWVPITLIFVYLIFIAFRNYRQGRQSATVTRRL